MTCRSVPPLSETTLNTLEILVINGDRKSVMGSGIENPGLFGVYFQSVASCLSLQIECHLVKVLSRNG